MSKELMIERIEKAQKEIEAKREKVQQGKFRQSSSHFLKWRTEVFCMTVIIRASLQKILQ